MDSKLLWQQIQNGNRDAFATLFKMYYPDLKAYGQKIVGNEVVVQEGIQLVFLKIWERREQLQEVHHPKAYILKVFRNIILDIVSSENKRAIQLKESAPFFTTNDFSTPYEKKVSIDTPTLHLLLNQLNDKQKEILFLKFYNNLPYKEIADVLGVTYQTVRNYTLKALRTLREKMELNK